MYVATVMYELYFFDQNNGMTFLLNNTYNNALTIYVMVYILLDCMKIQFNLL